MVIDVENVLGEPISILAELQEKTMKTKEKLLIKSRFKHRFHLAHQS